jgi:hypothetical protein
MKNKNLPDYTPPPPPIKGTKPDTSLPHKDYSDPVKCNKIMVSKCELFLSYLIFVVIVLICCLKIHQLQDKVHFMDTEYKLLLQVCHAKR